MSRPLEILNEVFGYPAFRGQQGEIVEHVAGGGDCLVLMPTGGGKSLCYQIPSLVRREAGLGAGIGCAGFGQLMQDQVAVVLGYIISYEIGRNVKSDHSIVQLTK